MLAKKLEEVQGSIAFDKIDIQIPNKVGLLGCGAVGKVFVEMLLQDYPNANLVVVDQIKMPEDPRYRFIQHQVTRQNLFTLIQIMELENSIFQFYILSLKKGDFLIDLSTEIDCIDLIPLCQQNGVLYLNSSLEVWEDNEDQLAFPTNPKECYNASIGYQLDAVLKINWKGPTTIIQMGMNPGLITICVKKALEDAAAYYLAKETENQRELAMWLQKKDHSKLAQALKVHTIHCSEVDNQVYSDQTPDDLKQKFYNTWSNKGFLSESFTPAQIARGSHEDENIEGFCLVRDGTFLMSFVPGITLKGKSWVPNEDIIGALIPHGESYTIQAYLKDPETGYIPSQYYVYDYNPYAKEFLQNLPMNANPHDLKCEEEIMIPKKNLIGVDKVGALLLMQGNVGWWTGSIMNEEDCHKLFGSKFGPTPIQVAAGVYAGFLWGCKNPHKGLTLPEQIDYEFLLQKAQPFLGTFVSMEVDLQNTKLNNCVKLQDFLLKDHQN